ncbi:MAG: muconolactone Delta-isomerase family protein [Actinobacteria bacterium]|nr:muconolactone Delta-isomerase family protein [Actinomycetota bacterium]
MRFLVEIRVDFPPDLRDPSSERRGKILAAELDRGLELRRDGVIEHIWRVPGALHNFGVWQAADATALHEAISSLPAFPWIEARVTPLADHPIEIELGS